MSNPNLDRLDQVIADLLAENGCPWDREQTPASLTEYLIEECFELVDAIRNKQPKDVKEELGDVLFLLVFISRLYQEKGTFNLEEVINANADKMIRRHPHVFADTEIKDRASLIKNWEHIKKAEQAAEDAAENIIENTSENATPAVSKGIRGVYDNLPRSLPPLTKAYRIHSKAANIGFTWPEDEEVEQQVEAEWLELLDASAQQDAKAIEHELGDHLFSLVEFGRRKGIKAAAALDMATNRFLDRFKTMEELARQRSLNFTALSLDEKDELWEEAKKQGH